MGEVRSGGPGTGGAPTVLRMILARRLKDLRESVGFSLEEAAKALRVTPLTIRRMEKAEVGLKIPYVEKLLRSYGADQQETDEFVEMAEQAARPGWWHNYRDVLPGWFTAYVSLETAAKLLRGYEPHYVTGLLQTPGYAEAILRAGFPDASAEELERRVELRTRRAALLEREGAPTVWSVMDETVLRRQVGGDAVMREQIDRLLEAAELPNVSLGIIPFTAGAHVGAFAPFTYFRFEEPELPDVVYTEVLTGCVYFDQRPDVASHLEAHNRMALLTSSGETKAILNEIRKEYS